MMTVGEKHTISSVHTLAQENSAAIQEIRDQLKLLATEAAARRAGTNVLGYQHRLGILVILGMSMCFLICYLLRIQARFSI